MRSETTQMVTAGGNAPGVAIVVHGHNDYASAAEHLALTLRLHSPNVPVHLWAAPNMRFDHSLFTEVHPLDPAFYEQGPGACKTLLYDLLPEGKWLYLDADTLCIADITPALERLSNHDFAIEVLGMGKEGDPINYMPWASPGTIREVANIGDGATYYGVQSSWVWITKPSTLCANIYTAAKATRFEPKHLKEKWGRDIPDELRMSAALTKTGTTPHSEKLLFYGNGKEYKNLAEVAQDRPLLCLYGDRRQHRLIRTSWFDAYDKYIRKVYRDSGRQLYVSLDRIMDNKYINR